MRRRRPRPNSHSGSDPTNWSPTSARSTAGSGGRKPADSTSGRRWSARLVPVVPGRPCQSPVSWLGRALELGEELGLDDALGPNGALGPDDAELTGPLA